MNKSNVIFFVLLLIVIIGLCSVSFFACAKYGNKPITEIPESINAIEGQKMRGRAEKVFIEIAQ